jgi:hypothetical protein
VKGAVVAENDPMLANLQAKVAAWQAALDSYLAAKGLDGASAEGLGSSSPRGSIELPVNAFRGMTMNEAIKLLLKAVQRKQSTSEIADGLKSGGFVTTAKDIGPTLRSALNKLKTEGVLLRFPDGWDLAEAHSAMIRHRVTKESAKTKKAGKKAKASKAKAAQAHARKAASVETLDARAEKFLRSRQGEGFTAKQIADALGLPDASKLILSLSRMVRYKKALKTEDGRFSVAKVA